MSNPNPAGRIDQRQLAALIQFDEQLAMGVDDVPLDAEGDLLSDDVQACLRLLNDVRQATPDLLTDSIPSDETGGLCLDADGDLPARIGRFEIIRKLGKGGFGVVFLARDPDLDRHVALKVPRIETLLHGEARRRFLREAKSAASLGHVNIAAIYESGSVGAICYIASAYCPGDTLSNALAERSGRISARDAAHLLVAIAQAVQHAHSRQIVHRDLKPSNILIDAKPDEIDQLLADPRKLASRLRLVDFGLSSSPFSNDESTQAGVVLGTPAYMAPEQAIGRTEIVGPAADIYALGAVLHWMLTGNPPFQRSSDVETLIAARQEPLASMRRRDPSIPRDLDSICRQCLDKEPDGRYASATELADDLERFLAGDPVRARRIGVGERTWRWCLANLSIAVLSGMLVLCLSILAAGSFIMANRFRDQRDQLAQSLERAELAERTATDMVETLRLRMDALNGEDVITGWTKIIDHGSANGRAYVTRGEAYMRQGKFRESVADFEQAIAMEPEFPWGKLYLSWVLSVGPESLRDPARAVRLAEEGLEFFPDRHWSALHVLSYAYYRQGRFEESLNALTQAIEQRGDGGHSVMLFFLAMCHYQLGHQPDANRHFDLAMEQMSGSSELSFHMLYAIRDEARKLLGRAKHRS